MPCLVPERKIAYFPVPKCGCTTLKLVCYQAENGNTFKMFTVNGQKRHIHTLYRSEAFQKEYYKKFAHWTRIVVIRDPLKRLLSAYCNRVLRYKELGSKDGTGNFPGIGRLPVEPDIDQFAQHLKGYIKGSKSVAHHLESFSHFLGKDLNWYDQVLKFEDFDRVKETFSSLLGQDLEFPKTQHSPAIIEPGQLSAVTKAILSRYLKEDYRYLRDYYGQ